MLVVLFAVVAQAFDYHDDCNDDENTAYITAPETDEYVTLPSIPIPLSLFPTPSGFAVAEGYGAQIDYSNVADGYVMVRYAIATDMALRVRIATPNGNNYNYALNNNMEYETFAISEGNGEYTISVLRHYVGELFEQVLTHKINVVIADKSAPFLRPNQYVNFSPDSLFLHTAIDLGENNNDYETIDAIYEFIIDNMSYCLELEENISFGYIPCLDRTYTEMTGVCFDIASLMVAMLRVNDIPAVLVFGNFRDEYHAWVEAYTETSGWIRRDPTSIITCVNGRFVLESVNTDSNYTARLYY